MTLAIDPIQLSHVRIYPGKARINDLFVLADYKAAAKTVMKAITPFRRAHPHTHPNTRIIFNHTHDGSNARALYCTFSAMAALAVELISVCSVVTHIELYFFLIGRRSDTSTKCNQFSEKSGGGTLDLTSDTSPHCINALTTSSFHLPPNWWTQKITSDAPCGRSADTCCLRWNARQSKLTSNTWCRYPSPVKSMIRVPVTPLKLSAVKNLG